MSWLCFMVVETDRARAWLRRYVSFTEERCPAMPGDHSYHEARTQIEDQPLRKTGDGYYAAHPVEPFAGDPRWPTNCACGRSFRDSDRWQILTHALYAREDGAEGEWTIADMPIGAMFDTFWLPKPWVGADGRSLSVKLPPGGESDLWHIDSEASSGGRWAREGTPPNITVSPSILTNRYHGFLQQGSLTDSLPDRPL